MSGVIENGQQWEHCNRCGEFVLFVDMRGNTDGKLFTLLTSNGVPCADLCGKCAGIALRDGFRVQNPSGVKVWLKSNANKPIAERDAKLCGFVASMKTSSF